MGDIAKAYFERYKHFNDRYAPTAPPSAALKLSIVLPAYRESALKETLQSLGNCSLPDPQTAELLLVINQSSDDHHAQPLHQEQVAQWHGRSLANGLKVNVIAALDLAPKQAGVGLARKIGMDAALARFDQIGFDGWIVNLDADCLVSADYLVENLRHSRDGQLRGASLALAHRLPEDDRARKAAIDYENWLRYYSAALRWSQYPHYHLTIGSAMAVRASAYASLGGMNQRRAAEDFYFLHKVMPGGSFAGLSAPLVYPSARVSDRVPFGTGRGIAEQLAGEKDFSLVYAPAIFQELKTLHQGGWRQGTSHWSAFLAEHAKINRSFSAFLNRQGEQASNADFFKWWDGFKVLKFVHFISNQRGEVPLAEALRALWRVDLRDEAALAFLQGLDH